MSGAGFEIDVPNSDAGRLRCKVQALTQGGAICRGIGQARWFTFLVGTPGPTRAEHRDRAEYSAEDENEDVLAHAMASSAALTATGLSFVESNAIERTDRLSITRTDVPGRTRGYTGHH